MRPNRIAVILGFSIFFGLGAFAAIINPLPYIFQNGTTADATQVNADFAQIVANVNANALAATAASLVPSSAVMPFNLAACPTGWIAADGTGGSPDMRGYFARGLDTGGSIDPSRTLASLQQDQFQDHGHALAGAFNQGGQFGFNAAAGGQTVSAGPGLIVVGGANGGNRGPETRPKNVALLYCMKS